MTEKTLYAVMLTTDQLSMLRSIVHTAASVADATELDELAALQAALTNEWEVAAMRPHGDKEWQS